jgi:histidinol-phosphate phosphatase family protein
MRPAAFLDRDGTIVPDTGFLRDPARVTLIDGSAEALVRLRAAGLAIVVITNQSGIARGLLTTEEYQAVAERIDRLLAEAGASIDATYFCPHHPDRSPCECRKPGLAHYRDAAARLDLDVRRSLFIGDRITDLEPARALGGRGILVLTGDGRAHRAQAERAGFEVAPDLAGAVALALASEPGPG